MGSEWFLADVFICLVSAVWTDDRVSAGCQGQVAKACKSPLSHCSTYTTSFMSHSFLKLSLRLHLVNSFFPSTLHKLCLPALSLHLPLLSRDSHVTSVIKLIIKDWGSFRCVICWTVVQHGPDNWPRVIMYTFYCLAVQWNLRPPRCRDNLSTKDTCLNPMLKYFSAISPPR